MEWEPIRRVQIQKPTNWRGPETFDQDARMKNKNEAFHRIFTAASGGFCKR
jgi:hypothetical protein